MSFIADTHNNPFHVDDSTLPPQRSALAVLDVERDELREIGLQAAMDRARKRLGADPGLAVVYGRGLHEDDLRIAYVRLESARDRVVNEVLDYRFVPFQVGDLPELKEVLEAFRAALASEESPRVEDPSLIARLLRPQIPAPTLPALAPLSCAKPELPDLENLLGD